LAGKECIVTGGARGLGLCIAVSLLEAGSPHVHCLDILQTPDATEWAVAQKTASKYGVQLSYYRVDITNETEVDQVFTKIYDDSVHPVAGFFAAAGIQQMIPALEYPIKDFRRLMEVNVTGEHAVFPPVA
jgi:NAD(P)-dependent dehydrogenase (short-subunit alcohol dehydrogenase family)